MSDLQYPIGRFARPRPSTPELRQNAINQIAALPGEIRRAAAGLSDAQLDTPYRPSGWTIRQVIHHLPDSHLNSYVRYRLALTEEEPTIKPYAEERWAELPDAQSGPVEMSLKLLESLHVRWVVLLRSLTDEQWKRKFNHPEDGVVDLETNVHIYAWHGRHHLAHITGLRERMGW